MNMRYNLFTEIFIGYGASSRDNPDLIYVYNGIDTHGATYRKKQ